jgi:hypothetical protein
MRAAALAVACAAVSLVAPAAPASASGDAPGPSQVVTIADPRISESSGLVTSPTHDDLVWTVNDSGHTATVFGVSLSSGRTVALLRLRDTDARDWESMAAQRLPDGQGVLWIGDTGDNNENRESIVLRLVREPSTLPDPGGTVTVTPVSLRVRYPDGAHDVEALVATPDGRLLLVSKVLFFGSVFEVPPDAVAQVLAGRSVTTPVTARNVGGVKQSLVTDGAALPDGRIVLRGYVDAAVYSDNTRDDRGLDAQTQVSLPAQQQGETLAVVDGGAALLVGSEGVKQPLWRVPLGAVSASGTDSTTSQPTRAAGSSTSGAVTDDQSAAARVPSDGGHDVLVWVLRVAALLLIPVAFALALRRRR